MMIYGRLARWGGLIAVVVATAGAAPAPPSYVGLEQRIARIRSAWMQPGAVDQPNAASWNTFFDALTADLQAYRGARTHDEQLRALARLSRKWYLLGSVGWAPAQDLRAELQAWLQPRVTLSWADLYLFQSLGRAPVVPGGMPVGVVGLPAPLADQWVKFGADMRAAHLAFEGAQEVGEQVRAVERLNRGLASLQRYVGRNPWPVALQYEAAVRSLISHPNLDATLDLNTVAPILNMDPIKPEVVNFKGQTSYVTPGPRTGFGLLPSDAGIAFYNSQISYSVTPIRGFQEQVAADPQGQRAARLYQFSATSYNQAHAMIRVLLTPDGLIVMPDVQSNVDGNFGIAPIPGHGKHVTRSIAGLVGFGPDEILQQVEEEALPQLREQTASGSRELSQIKAGQEQAKFNAQLARFLIGNRTAVVGEFAVSNLSLSSRPWYVRANGLVQSRVSNDQTAAAFPKPLSFAAVPPGVAVDVHLSSLLGNVAAGLFEGQLGQNYQTVQLELTPAATEGEAAPPPAITPNTTYEQYLARVRELREEQSGANVLRVVRPAQAPRFSADAQGRLVILLEDFSLDVPAPPAAARGGLLGAPVDVYRVQLPTAQVVVSFQVDASDPTRLRVTGKIDEFNYDNAATVTGLRDDESDGQPLNPLTRSVVLGTIANQIAGRPIDAPIPLAGLRGFVIDGVSPLDPTGWMRVTLRRTAEPLNLSMAGN